MRIELSIKGMTCNGCANGLKKLLLSKNGIQEATIILAQEKGVIEFDPNLISVDEILSIIEDAGFDGAIL